MIVTTPMYVLVLSLMAIGAIPSQPGELERDPAAASGHLDSLTGFEV
jgi:hypothetical protein